MKPVESTNYKKLFIDQEMNGQSTCTEKMKSESSRCEYWTEIWRRSGRIADPTSIRSEEDEWWCVTFFCFWLFGGVQMSTGRVVLLIQDENKQIAVFFPPR